MTSLRSLLGVRGIAVYVLRRVLRHICRLCMGSVWAADKIRTSLAAADDGRIRLGRDRRQAETHQ